jgi:hypothetical protein
MPIRSSRQPTSARPARRTEVSARGVTTANAVGASAGSSWLTRLGVQCGYLAGVLGVAGFGLFVLAPHEQALRATHPLWLTAAMASWASSMVALLFLTGLAAAAAHPSRVGRLAWAVAFLATAASSATHTRVLVDYAAQGLDPAFAARLHDIETPLAQVIFAVIALMALAGWTIVALTLGRDAQLAATGRVALVVAGVGVMLPIPLTALALLAAARAFAHAPKRPRV